MGVNDKLNNILSIVTVILIVMFFVFVIVLSNSIPLVKDATAEEIAAKCNDIGLGYYRNGKYYVGLAEKIVNYIKLNPDFKIDDLININGIGPKRLKEIKRYFR